MLRRSFQSIAGTWLAGLLLLLPLALTAAVLIWAFSLVNRLVGPGSFVGGLFSAVGYSFSDHPDAAYVLGTLVLIAAIYVLGLIAQLGLKGPLKRLAYVALRRIPIVGSLYKLADRFVGLLDQKQEADIGAMSPVWCFFGGKGAAVLALAPSAQPVDDRRPELSRGAGADRAGAVRRRADLRAGRVGAPGEHRGRQADRDLRFDGHHAAAGARIPPFLRRPRGRGT